MQAAFSKPKDVKVRIEYIKNPIQYFPFLETSTCITTTGEFIGKK